MKILIFGGSNSHNVYLVYKTLTPLHRSKPITSVAHTNESGIGRIIAKWAKQHGVEEIVYTPSWYDQKEPVLRNAMLLAFESPDVVIAMSDDLATRNLVAMARKNHIKTLDVGSK